VNACALCHVYNIVYVGIVVVVGSSWHLDKAVRHANVLGVDAEVFRCGHDGKLDLAVRAEGLVRPFSDGADLLDGGDTVVGDQDLESALNEKLAYLGDDSVAALGLDKVGDSAGGGDCESIGAYSSATTVPSRLDPSVPPPPVHTSPDPHHYHALFA
jgi:hypothetical protein